MNNMINWIAHLRNIYKYNFDLIPPLQGKKKQRTTAKIYRKCTHLSKYYYQGFYNMYTSVLSSPS